MNEGEWQTGRHVSDILDSWKDILSGLSELKGSSSLVNEWMGMTVMEVGQWDTGQSERHLKWRDQVNRSPSPLGGWGERIVEMMFQWVRDSQQDVSAQVTKSNECSNRVWKRWHRWLSDMLVNGAKLNESLSRARKSREGALRQWAQQADSYWNYWRVEDLWY